METVTMSMYALRSLSDVGAPSGHVLARESRPTPTSNPKSRSSCLCAPTLGVVFSRTLAHRLERLVGDGESIVVVGGGEKRDPTTQKVLERPSMLAGHANHPSDPLLSLFFHPAGMALRGTDIAVADRGNHAIRMVDAKGLSRTLTGHNGPGLRDGPPHIAQFNLPEYIAAGPFGRLYIMSDGDVRLRRIDASGTVVTIAGSRGNAYVDGPGHVARFHSGGFPVWDGMSSFIVADFTAARLRRVTLDGHVSTFAGTAFSGLLDSDALLAKFEAPKCIADRGRSRAPFPV